MGSFIFASILVFEICALKPKVLKKKHFIRTDFPDEFQNWFFNYNYFTFFSSLTPKLNLMLQISW